MYRKIVLEQLQRLENIRPSSREYYNLEVSKTIHINLGRCTGKTYFAEDFYKHNTRTTLLFNSTNKVNIRELQGYKSINQTFPNIRNLKYIIIDEPRVSGNWKDIYYLLRYFDIMDVSIILLGDI